MYVAKKRAHTGQSNACALWQMYTKYAIGMAFNWQNNLVAFCDEDAATIFPTPQPKENTA